MTKVARPAVAPGGGQAGARAHRGGAADARPAGAERQPWSRATARRWLYAVGAGVGEGVGTGMGELME